MQKYQLAQQAAILIKMSEVLKDSIGLLEELTDEQSESAAREQLIQAGSCVDSLKANLTKCKFWLEY